MPCVVFLRGVNVGGHKRFSPAELARRLAHLDVVNLGAAGTFVVRKPIGTAALRAQLTRHIPFECEQMICSQSELLDLAHADAFAGTPAESADLKRYVTVLAKRPRRAPRLPLCAPNGPAWQVKLLALRGRFVVSLWRRTPSRSLLYPNEVVEKAFGIPATTRNWNTFAKTADVIRGQASSARSSSASS
jgi:uncharacterized protein (DUF1697 family)